MLSELFYFAAGGMNVKLLIFGCGVIGSVYAVRFAAAGYDVAVYARGSRLSELRENGLLYQKSGAVYRSAANVTDRLDEAYDFVFVTVKYEQLYDALRELEPVQCGNIVTMVNNPFGYEKCAEILGKGRLIAAFPGAGGVIENGVLKAGLTPSVIQKTTFGEPDGRHTERIKTLREMFRRAEIPYEECLAMTDWQLCHLGLVVPLADAIYHGRGDNYDAGRNWKVMRRAAYEVQRNLAILRQSGVQLLPSRMRLLASLPEHMLAAGLSKLYCSEFGTQFIFGHSQKARNEMMTLRRDYYMILKERLKELHGKTNQ